MGEAQRLGKIGEDMCEKFILKKFDLKKGDLKRDLGCDFTLPNGTKIEVKTTSKEKGIPDSDFREFENYKDPKFVPDYLYIIRIIDNNRPKITILTKEQINKYSHKPKKVVKFSSTLKTDLKNNKFESFEIDY